MKKHRKMFKDDFKRTHKSSKLDPQTLIYKIKKSMISLILYLMIIFKLYKIKKNLNLNKNKVLKMTRKLAKT